MKDEHLTAPGLVAHLFLATPSQDAAAGWQPLRSLWHNITSHFALDRPTRLPSVPAHLPRDPVLPPDGVGLLAAAECGEPSVWQATAWADHDILCLTVMMAPPRDQECGRTWADLESAWQEATSAPPSGEVLGEARTFLSLLAPAADDGPAPGATADRRALDLVRATVPEPASANWWQHWDVIPLGSQGCGPGEVLVWEIGPESSDGRIVRRLTAVAPAAFEHQADHLLWTNGDGTPAPLARHLMQAARLRHQIRVFDDGNVPRRLRGELSLAAERLSDSSADGPGRAGLQRVSGSAAAMRARLGAMRHAADIIGDNMRRTMSLPANSRAVGPLSEDRELAASFRVRLDDEITRLDAALRGARDALDFPAARPPEPVRRQGRGQSRRAASSPEPWAVIFTALEVEYGAIRDYLADPVEQHEERGTLYEVGAIPGVSGSWRVAVAQTGPGSTTAGVQLERAVPVFAPEVVLFLGVAGGRKDVALGDIVVAETIYDYEWGKSTLTGYQPRMRTRSPAFRLLQRARLVVRENRWQQRIRPSCPMPPPTAFVKPIVTGGKVVAHSQSAVAQLLDQYANDALAVEMEGHGFLEGAYVNPGVDALVIRGISDLLAGKDKASDDYWQPAASRHAAAFAVELLHSIGRNRA